jgi:hypothetical protein
MMSDDDKLKSFLAMPPLGPNVQPLPIPSGWRCPHCQKIAPMAPNGGPVAMVVNKAGIQTYHCIECVQASQMGRRVLEILEDVPALVRETESPNGSEPEEA